MMKDVQNRQTREGRGLRKSAKGLRALVTGLLFSAGALASSSPAFANWDGGAEHSDDWNADHNDIYQVQRGDLVCESREACGGPAAIPMNRPGYWYLPGGLNTLHRYARGPDAPYAAYHPRHYHHKHRLNH
jgi:hypothetical protein